MALHTNALLTIAEVKAYLDIPAGDTDYDVRVESVVNALTDMFEAYTGRDTIVNSAVIEYTEGKDDETIFLRNPPISEVTSSVVICIDTDRLYPAANNLTRSTDFVVYARTGKIVLIDDYFPSNPQCLKISYYGGWTTVPSDIRRAAFEAAQWMWKRERDGRVGVTSVSAQAGGSVSYEEAALPKSVTDVLDRYRQWSA